MSGPVDSSHLIRIARSPPPLAGSQQQPLTRSQTHAVNHSHSQSHYQNHYHESPATTPTNASHAVKMPASISSSSLSSLRQRGSAVADVEAINLTRAREQLSSYKSELKAARQKIKLFHSPVQTITIFGTICFEYLQSTLKYFVSHTSLLFTIVATVAAALILYLVPGFHQSYLFDVYSLLGFAAWWVMLGVLSSVGLGTGLHTFVLYLGPYIAKVTLAVTECNTLDVPLSGPQAFMCPTNALTMHSLAPATLTGILWKIAPAAFLWGAGTAIGELPPYFVSRAATLSGQKLAELDEVEEIEEQEESEKKQAQGGDISQSLLGKSKPASHVSLMDHAKVMIYHALQRYGFWAIVVFASIPNPLFDLAGLACGHFLIPFWTFFGATCIGKAVVKVQLQSALVIMAFSKDSLTQLIHAIENISPATISGKIMPFFEKQRQQFHLAGGHDATSSTAEGESVNLFGMLWNFFLTAMILWFVVSIVDSTVQERLAIRDAVKIERFASERKIPTGASQPNASSSTTTNGGISEAESGRSS